ncbi:IS607 family transposase [Moorena sp. SIO3H5]|uniref:IS607 family transposase n=1 Tax=Moorena sp. SIO3H5 TaxID=2607834 RepID=UPI0013B8DF43|nr:IS607 family transposase [Moorena sp. SIO3H5]NEO71098.1 IS607 family transposase [Moorena sp. SIO3H5]
MSVNYVPPRVAAQRLGVSTRTLERWLEAWKIKGIKTPGGQRRYDLDSVVSIRPAKPKRDIILYARVSSRSQKSDLEQQVRFLKSRYPGCEVIFDIGSGLNFKRFGLQSLLDRVLSNTCELIVVAHKDRLCRFGFDLISWLCGKFETKILVLDETHLSPEQEMVEDILAIVHVFSCRLYGQWKYKKRILDDSELPSLSSKGT